MLLLPLLPSVGEAAGGFDGESLVGNRLLAVFICLRTRSDTQLLVLLLPLPLMFILMLLL